MARPINEGLDYFPLPFDFFDDFGEYRGMCSDFALRAEAELDISFLPPKKIPWAETIERAKQGKKGRK